MAPVLLFDAKTGYRRCSFHLKPLASSRGGFTLVEVIIALTIVVVIIAGAVPTVQEMRAQQQAREPVLNLVRIAKEARLRAIQEKRPYQIAFHSSGFTASRYFDPYLQLADLNTYLQESETGVVRRNPNVREEEEIEDPDTGASTNARTELPMAPAGRKFDNHWTEKYTLPDDTHYTFKFWYEVDETPIEGEVVKLWVFQPTGICQPVNLRLDSSVATFDIEFGALTADLVKQSVHIK